MMEELEEYRQACEGNDLIGALDALVDLDVMLLGSVGEMGLQDVFVPACNEVFRANMSKVCPTRAIAEETVAQYTQQGVATYLKEVGTDFVVYRTEDNKFLKNRYWSAPDYSTILSVA